MKEALSILPRLLQVLSRFHEVTGAGLGLRERGNSLTSTLAWRIYVKHKLPASALSPDQLIPPFMLGLPTDVIEMAPAASQSGQGYPQLPLYIANCKGIPGTAGCVAWEGPDQKERLLSNYHVLCGHGAEPGDKVFEVLSTGDKPTFKHLGKTAAGHFGIIETAEGRRFIDAALVETEDPLALQDKRHLRVKGMASAQIGETVHKTGAISGFTTGIITDIVYPEQAQLDYDIHPAPGQILIRPLSPTDAFSAPGDSGSAVVNADGRIVGLLWGLNTRGEGIACHIAPVASQLNLCFDPPPAPVVQQNWLGRFFSRFRAAAPNPQ